LKAILFDHRDGFADDQWNTVSNLLSDNRLNDEQFSIFVDMLSEIHKSKPEDLEYSIIENSITNSGTNGPNEDPIGSHLGVLN
jgi:hypothetical protein